MKLAIKFAFPTTYLSLIDYILKIISITTKSFEYRPLYISANYFKKCCLICFKVIFFKKKKKTFDDTTSMIKYFIMVLKMKIQNDNDIIMK